MNTDSREYNERMALYYADIAEQWAKSADGFRKCYNGDPDNTCGWRAHAIRQSQNYAAEAAAKADKFLMWAQA